MPPTAALQHICRALSLTHLIVNSTDAQATENSRAKMKPVHRKAKAGQERLTRWKQSDGAAASPSSGQFAMQPVGGSDLADAVQQGVAGPEAVEEVLVDVYQVLRKKAATLMRGETRSRSRERASGRTECAKKAKLVFLF